MTGWVYACLHLHSQGYIQQYLSCKSPKHVLALPYQRENVNHLVLIIAVGHKIWYLRSVRIFNISSIYAANKYNLMGQKSRIAV